MLEFRTERRLQLVLSPRRTAVRSLSTETFQWLHGGFFLEHRWDATHEGDVIDGALRFTARRGSRWSRTATVQSPTRGSFDTLTVSGAAMAAHHDDPHRVTRSPGRHR
jgi:hypothetical protein